MSNTAPRRTSQTFTATGSGGALTVASGEPVTVFGMALYAGTAAAVFTITDASDNTEFVIGVAANETYETSTKWKADAGIKVQISAVAGSPHACVFHESPGN